MAVCAVPVLREMVCASGVQNLWLCSGPKLRPWDVLCKEHAVPAHTEWAGT